MAFLLSGGHMGPREKGPGLELGRGEQWVGLKVLPHTCRPLAWWPCSCWTQAQSL